MLGTLAGRRSGPVDATSSPRPLHHRRPNRTPKRTSLYLDCSESGALETLPQAVRDLCGTLLKNFDKKKYVMSFGTTPFKLAYKDINDLIGLRFRLFYKKGLGMGKTVFFYNTRSTQWSECIAWTKSVCRGATVRGRWLPRGFDDFCKDTWYECRTLEEPWKYGGIPGMQEWNR